MQAPKIRWALPFVLGLVLVANPAATETDAGTNIGAFAPDVTLSHGFNGIDASHTLRAWRGHPVVLKFWSPQCAPCKRQLPALQKLQKRYARKGLRILAISLADPNGSNKICRKGGYTFPVGIDAQKATTARYGVKAIPATFLVGKDGRLVPVGGSLEDTVRRELGRK